MFKHTFSSENLLMKQIENYFGKTFNIIPQHYTKHSHNFGLMVGQRRRRWSSIDPTFGVLCLLVSILAE